MSVIGRWADFSHMPRQNDNAARWRIAFEFYPCDVLFVHRDAEAQLPAFRREEVTRALAHTEIPHVPVIPVRMTEAWLLADENAIRRAAGNPNGDEELNLPDISTGSKISPIRRWSFTRL